MIRELKLRISISLLFFFLFSTLSYTTTPHNGVGGTMHSSGIQYSLDEIQMMMKNGKWSLWGWIWKDLDLKNSKAGEILIDLAKLKKVWDNVAKTSYKLYLIAKATESVRNIKSTLEKGVKRITYAIDNTSFHDIMMGYFDKNIKSIVNSTFFSLDMIYHSIEKAVIADGGYFPTAEKVQLYLLSSLS